MHHLVTAKGRLVKAHGDIRAQILAPEGGASLLEAGASKAGASKAGACISSEAALKAGACAAPEAALAAVGAMKDISENISKHIVHIGVSIKMELMIGAVAGTVAAGAKAALAEASASIAAASETTVSEAAIEAGAACSRAGTPRPACLVKGRETELIVQFLLFRVA